jgi:hypothetical protein
MRLNGGVQRIATTVVALVGEPARACLDALGRAANVATVRPDYYLVLDPETWEATRRHFYLGVLHRAAPSRVVPVVGTPERVGAQLGGLRSGRWWPEVDRLLDSIDRVVPDQVQAAPPGDEGGSISPG